MPFQTKFQQVTTQKQVNNRPHITLLIGNPGTGKSSILNSLTEGLNFKSGISIGSGVTQVHKIFRHTDQEWFADTPGLDDIEMRKQAAAEIEKALKQDADYTICFVVTLESGRLRPTDLSTMELVLESIKLPTGLSVKYGLIINKLEPEVRKEFENPENLKVFCAQLNFCGGTFFTDSIFLYEFDRELQGKNDMVPPKNVELEMFLKMLHKNTIDVKNVHPIEYDKMEKLRNEYEEKTMRLLKDNEYLKRQLGEMSANAMERETLLMEQQRQHSTSPMGSTRGNPDTWGNNPRDVMQVVLEIADYFGVFRAANCILRIGVIIKDAIDQVEPRHLLV